MLLTRFRDEARGTRVGIQKQDYNSRFLVRYMMQKLVGNGFDALGALRRPLTIAFVIGLVVGLIVTLGMEDVEDADGDFGGV